MGFALTYRDAAKFLSCSEKTVWNMVHVYKTLPFVLVGKRGKRIPVRALENYVNGCCLSEDVCNG